VFRSAPNTIPASRFSGRERHRCVPWPRPQCLLPACRPGGAGPTRLQGDIDGQSFDDVPGTAWLCRPGREALRLLSCLFHAGREPSL